MTLAAGFAAPAPADSVAGHGTARVLAVSPCYSADNGFPDLTGFSISRRTVDVRRHAAALTTTATAVDQGGPGPASGVRRIDLEIWPYQQTGVTASTLVRQSDGTWRGSIAVALGARPGRYTVRLVGLRDGAGHRRDYPEDWLRADGFGIDFMVVSTADRRAPVLRDLAFSTTSVDSSSGTKLVRVTARVSDERAGVDHVWVETDVTLGISLRIHRGSRLDGTWTGRFVIPWWVNARYSPYPVFVDLADRVGHERGVYSETLARRGFPSELAVRSTRTDRDPPRVRSLTLHPETVDLTTGTRQVVVTIHASDAASGVGPVTVWPPAPGWRTQRISGTRYDGVWRKTVTLPRCGVTTGQVRLEVIVPDRGTKKTIAHPTITVVNRTDISRPYPRSVSPEESGPLQAVTYTFSENVTGISPTSAQVMPGEGWDRTSPADPPPVQPGTWFCRSPTGTEADCLTGAVRTATWTPSRPLAPGTYGVEFNPEHVLDVTDLAGNPIDEYVEFEEPYIATWTVIG